MFLGVSKGSSKSYAPNSSWTDLGSDWKGIIRVPVLPDPPAYPVAAVHGEALAPSDEAGVDFFASPEVPAPWELVPAESWTNPNIGESRTDQVEDSGGLSLQLLKC